jgi:ribosomal protein S18 acetylase RimI-like enzyme
VSELKLRRYRESDQAAVQELHLLGLIQVGSKVNAGPWDEDIRHIIEHYYHKGGEFLLGEYQGKLVAMGAFRKTGPQEAEIKRIRTHPDWQGRGFGQTIFTALEQRAREMGYTRLHLETSLLMIPAQKFYIKNGFIETHRGLVHLGQPAIFYEKYLLDVPKKEN